MKIALLVVFFLAFSAEIAQGVVKNITSITSKSSTGIIWDLSLQNYEGVELKPTDVFIFPIPKEYQQAKVRTVIIVHRKAEKYDGSVTYNDDGTFWDSQGAYVTIQCRDANTKSMKSWGASKFAEPRSASNPENDNLHDWAYFVGVFSADQIVVTNVSPAKNTLGVDNIHQIQIEFFPSGTIESTQIEVFSPGTTFIDLDKKILLPQYGGGPEAGLSYAQMEKDGLYPNASQVGYGAPMKTMSSQSYVDKSGKLHIKLPAGKIVGGVEISIGDTKYDKSIPPQDQINKDGGYGVLGWAKITAVLSFTNSICISDANVPPSGVLSGGPPKAGYMTSKGEEVIVTSSSAGWVMGYKIVFMKK